jgi:hypothetical protein
MPSTHTRSGCPHSGQKQPGVFGVGKGSNLQDSKLPMYKDSDIIDGAPGDKHWHKAPVWHSGRGYVLVARGVSMYV